MGRWTREEQATRTVGSRGVWGCSSSNEEAKAEEAGETRPTQERERCSGWES
jgi:hypothetical protein